MSEKIKICDRCKVQPHPKTIVQGTNRYWMICRFCAEEVFAEERSERWLEMDLPVAY